MKRMTLPVSKIVVSRRRRSVDQKSVDELKASILKAGLIQPILVTNDNKLVAGAHRFEAVKELGWERIPVRQVAYDDLQAELAEIDENVVRRPLTELEQAEALRRRDDILLELGERAIPGMPNEGRLKTLATTTKLAESVGIAPRTLRSKTSTARKLLPEVKTVIYPTPWADNLTELMALADLDDADQKLCAEAYCAGKIESVSQYVPAKAPKRRKALPNKKYKVLYADPPWQYRDKSGAPGDGVPTGAQAHYATMPTEDIAKMEVRFCAEKDAVLFLWATFPMLPDALQVMRGWGFDYKTAFVWRKDRKGYGHYHDCSAELLLVGTRGRCTPDLAKRDSQVLDYPWPGEHSRKPAEVRDLISRMYPEGRRLELFCRGKAPEGWDTHGLEAE